MPSQRALLLSAMVASVVFGVQAQSIPASATASQLTFVDEEYVNSGFPEESLTGFGVTLKSTALLEVLYDSFGVVSNGQALTADQVANEPTIYVTPSNATASTFDANANYTLVLADAASLGDPDVDGNYRHFLANGLSGAAGTDGNLTFVPSGGETITYYAGPGPIAGTGPHRYAWLLFSQPSTFAAPADLSTEGTAPSHWNVSTYVQDTGLTLIAASFFTVENGTPTGSVVATSAAQTAASSAAATSSGKASSTGSASSSAKSGSSTTSSAAAGASTSAKASSATTSIIIPAVFSLASVGAIAVFML